MLARSGEYRQQRNYREDKPEGAISSDIYVITLCQVFVICLFVGHEHTLIKVQLYYP